jgi:head-tail adaptor
MGLRSIVDPRLTGQLVTAGHYPQTVTIQAGTPARDDYGEPIVTWANVTGLTSLSAAIAPAADSEVATATGVYSDATDTILLPGEYPAITPRHRVTDGAGRVWDILAVDIGPFGEWTNLVGRIRTVGA